MLKKKVSSRLLGSIVSASILLNTLLVNLPLNSQPLPGETIRQTAQRELLKIKVEQKIKQIRSINWRLKAAQITIPGIIAGGGIAAALIPLSALIFTLLKNRKIIKLIRKNPTSEQMDQIIKKWKPIDYFMREIKNLVREFSDLAPVKPIKNANELIRKLKKGSLIDIILAPVNLILVVTIASALLGFTGITTLAVKGIFGLSTASVTRAFDNAKKLEQLEKNKLITLTKDQKAVIAKLKKRQKSPIIQGIIKNLRLSDIQKKLVHTAMQTNASLVAKLAKKKMSEKKMRKLFAKYIKARWEEKNLQKQAAELATMKKESKLKISITKQLDKMEKKVEKLDSQYPDLRTTLTKEVEEYSDKANKILEELKKDVMKAIDIKGLKPQPTPQPAIQL